MFPIPIDDISCRRISERIRTMRPPSATAPTHQGGWWGSTSVFQRLLPENPGQFFGPGLLHLLRHGLQGERVVRLALPEPDLELCRTVSDLRRQPDVRRLYAVLVNVNVQVLKPRRLSGFSAVFQLRRGQLTFLSGNLLALLNRINSSNRNTCLRHFLPFPCQTRNSFCLRSLPCSFKLTCKEVKEKKVALARG